jgi:adenylate kinase
MNLILLGPPGAGKGTQAKRLEQAHGFVHISSGDLFRAHIAANDELGREAKSYMDKGNLVPDDTTMRMLETEIDDPKCKNGFILDGFIRTIAQAEALDAMLTRRRMKLNAVIELKVNDDLLLDRVKARIASTPQGVAQRPDDNPEVLANRLKVYHTQTAPLLPYYREAGLLRSVDAMQDIDTVAVAIERVVAECG